MKVVHYKGRTLAQARTRIQTNVKEHQPLIGNYTSTNLAENLDQVSHETITGYLQNVCLTTRMLWELVDGMIADTSEAFLIVDGSVQDKRYSRFIELVKRQYSGTTHGLVRGIGLVNLVHSAGAQQDFYPIDYRIYAPDRDGKTKSLTSPCVRMTSRSLARMEGSAAMFRVCPV